MFDYFGLAMLLDSLTEEIKMKQRYKFNLNLAFDVEKSSTVSTRDSDMVRKRIDSNKNKDFMTLLKAWGPYVGLVVSLIKLYCVFK